MSKEFDVMFVTFIWSLRPALTDCNSLPELNLLALSFVVTAAHAYTLAILHIDHQQRVQLLSRDLDVDELELSITPSACLQRVILPLNWFPYTKHSLILVSVPPFPLDSTLDQEEAECLGGVLVLGGRKVIFVEAASVEEQKSEKGKEKRQQRRKSSGVEAMLKLAKQKEKEREAKKVKPRATVKWPWSEVVAYVICSSWARIDAD